MSSESITISVQIPLEQICNLIRSALDARSIEYWGVTNAERSRRPAQLDRSVLGDFESKTPENAAIHWAVFSGGVVAFEEIDEIDEEKHHELTLEKIKNGLEIMAHKFPHKLAEVLNDEVDGMLGDLFIQCCLFGEEKYS